MRKFIMLITIISLLLNFFIVSLFSQNTPSHFKNPILPGFNPDPSICRVGDDYYLVTSSFTWYPGLPIYHSKDLVNWKLVGHGIERPDMVDFNGLDDNFGIWAPTIRYHNGVFYIITTANKSGGNFYITAKDPKGPWSDPVWLKDAPGIDPFLFWDDDGKSYYLGNVWDFPKSWPSQVAIWIQEIDIPKGKLVGERKTLTYGHANNATFAEGPRLFKIDNQYVLLMSEGGTDVHHAVTVFHSKSLWGPYVADKINPLITHRHLGRNYPIQAVGHADLVQTQNGDWYAVVLAKRMLDGKNPLSRETFLAKVEFQNGTPIFNPGYGVLLPIQERPNLPWTPVEIETARDDFEKDELDSKWYFVRTPLRKFHSFQKRKLMLQLQPEVIDSMVNSAMIIQKTKHHAFTATAKMSFQTKKENEQAGIVLYRTANGYYALMKDKSGIRLIRKHLAKRETIGEIPYRHAEVFLRIEANGMNVIFSAGESPENMTQIGGNQSMEVVCDNRFNRFNGVGVGMYASSNGQPSKNATMYEWFEYMGF